MLELTIKEKTYSFKFGVGFVREIDKTQQQKLENGTVVNMGLQYAVAALIDRDPVKVVELLEVANKTEKPRISRSELDYFIDEVCEDFDEFCEEILDFFEKGNSTKKVTEAVKKKVTEEMAKTEATE